MKNHFSCRPEARRRPFDSSLLLRNPPDGPDVGLYNPLDALARGQAATWNNPDIRMVDQGRTAEVSVTNFSSRATAVNAVVQVSHSPFGIGETWEVIHRTLVTVAPSLRETILAPVEPHYVFWDDARIRCEVFHPDDINERNNRGERAVRPVVVDASDESSSTLHQQVRMVNARPDPQFLSLTVVNGPPDVDIYIPQQLKFAPFERRLVPFALDLATFPVDPNDPTQFVHREVTFVGRDESGAVVDGLTFNFGVRP